MAIVEGQKQSLGKSEPRTILITPPKKFATLNLYDIWVYRELVYFMVWRDLKVRYKQTLLGVLWAVLRPFLTMVVFSLIFGGLAKMPSDGIPYPLFSFAALLPWELFSKALNDGSRSLVNNQNMITKIYFPRVILPLSSVLGGLVDFGIALLVFVGMMIYYQVTPLFSALWALPLFLLQGLVAALGVSLWLSAMNVMYRDVGYILPFLTQIWLYISPITYPSSLVTGRILPYLFALNPLSGVIDGFRWVLLGTAAPGSMEVVSAGMAIILLITGMFYFRRMEKLFADMV